MLFNSQAERAARELEREVDKLAAELIRNEGLPLYVALREAQKITQCRRQGKKRIIPLTK